MKNKTDVCEYRAIVADIINNKDFLQTAKVRHHDSTVYLHSLKVSLLSYHLAKKFGWNYHETARAALLHDFFTERRRDVEKASREKYSVKNMHGFTHPYTALKNSSDRFELSAREADIIVKHMFPLTLSFPRYKESWLVTAVDKYLATREVSVMFFRDILLRRYIKSLGFNVN